MANHKKRQFTNKKQMVKLKNKKLLKETSSEIIGTHAIKAVLKHTPGRALLLTLLADNPRLKKLEQAALDAGVKVRSVISEQRTSSYQQEAVHQGAILNCKPFEYVGFGEHLKQGLSLVVILDGVQDPRNLGRASRSALCFGADLIVIPKDRSTQVTIAAEKTAVGALSQIPIAQVINLARAINILKKKGFFVVGAEADAKLACNKYEFGPKTALVIGGEDSGIRPLVRKACDQIVNIPMKRQDLSTNAADAATILLYEVSRQRSAL